jgi:hypothetical protein
MQEHDARLAQLIADGRRFQKLMRYAHTVPAGTPILISPPGKTKQQVEKTLRSVVHSLLKKKTSEHGTS